MLRGIILYILSIFLLCSCTTYYYLGNSTSHSIPDPKPICSDSSNIALYISGTHHKLKPFKDEQSEHQVAEDIEFSTAKVNLAFGNLDQVNSLGIYYYQGYFDTKDVTIKNQYAGQQSINNLIAPGGKKRFYGLGISIEAALRRRINNIEIRPIGSKINVNYEPGQYAEFRREIDQNSPPKGQFLCPTCEGSKKYRNASPNNIGLNLNAFSELIYIYKGNQIILYGSIGIGSAILSYSYGLGIEFGPVTVKSNISGNGVGVFYNINLSFRILKSDKLFNMSYSEL